MFGYVVADRTALSEEEIQRYQGCYCGLCRVIGQQYGTMRRLALNYDITFLVLLLSSLYEPDEQTTSGRCLAHLGKPKSFWSTEITGYGAAMNVALAYYHCMDDWQDDRSAKAFLQAKLFQTSEHTISTQYPRQSVAIRQCIASLKEIETKQLQDPDAGANAFGALMGQLLIWKEDRWAPVLYRLGESLGRYIYLLDALLDLPKDIRTGAYNPFTSRYQQGLKKEDYLPVLKILMGECTEAFEQLPLLQDLSLLRNILYSGVWTRFYAGNSPSDKEESHV